MSGGHTAIYRVDSYDEIKIVSNTQDDAAGEAFDKVSRMLGLGYPGGPVIERASISGDENLSLYQPSLDSITRFHFRTQNRSSHQDQETWLSS